MQLPHQLPVDPAALAPKRIAVGKSPARIIQPGPAAETALVVNRGAYIAYIGDGGVSDANNGLPVPPLGSVALSTSVERYAVIDQAAGNNTTDLWVLPAGLSYTPSPSEIAAQIAASHLDVSGSAIDVANQPTVTAAGANANGTPSTAAGFASRQVSADSSAFASVGTAASGTLIAAPGTGSLELHAAVINVTCTAGSITGPVSRTEVAQITRTDNGAVIAEVRCAAASTAANVSAGNQTSVTYDFQGATLPAGVGLNLTTVNSTGTGSGTGSVTLAYATVH